MDNADVVTVLRRRRPALACQALVARFTTLDLVYDGGRQGGGYTKADLISVVDQVVHAAVLELVDIIGGAAAFDAWHIVYPEGSTIAAHTDPSPADGLVHVRANLVIAAARGGRFVADGVVVELDVGDAVVFRPDVVTHAVSVVEGGRREVLSVGTVMTPAAADAVFAQLRRQPSSST